MRLWREKSALRQVQTTNDSCIVDKVICAGCKIGPCVSYGSWGADTEHSAQDGILVFVFQKTQGVLWLLLDWTTAPIKVEIISGLPRGS